MLVHWKSAAVGGGQELSRLIEQTAPLSVVIQFGVDAGHGIATPIVFPVQNLYKVFNYNHHFNF